MEEVEVSVADWLPVLSPHLSESLVDPEALQRLRELWCRSWGDPLVAIEVRLGEGARRVDSALRIASPGDARRVAPEGLPRHQRRFLARWGRDAGLGYPEPVSAVWLEFDLDGEPGSHRSPLVCARLEGPTRADWLVDVLFPALCGSSLGSRQTGAIRRALAALPRGAHLLYAFSLHPRQERTVRIEAFGRELTNLLSCLGTGASPAVAALVAPLAPLLEGADRYHLSLDIAEEVLPRVGIECGWRRLPHREPGWRRTLDRLVAAGLATADKRDALLAWPGYDTLWSVPSLWPAAALAGGGYLVRSLSHLKLVSTPGREPEAKAYLLFQHLVQAERTAGISRPSSSASASACRA